MCERILFYLIDFFQCVINLVGTGVFFPGKTDERGVTLLTFGSMKPVPQMSNTPK